MIGWSHGPCPPLVSNANREVWGVSGATQAQLDQDEQRTVLLGLNRTLTLTVPEVPTFTVELSSERWVRSNDYTGHYADIVADHLEKLQQHKLTEKTLSCLNHSRPDRCCITRPMQRKKAGNTLVRFPYPPHPIGNFVGQKSVKRW